MLSRKISPKSRTLEFIITGIKISTFFFFIFFFGFRYVGIKKFDFIKRSWCVEKFLFWNVFRMCIWVTSIGVFFFHPCGIFLRKRNRRRCDIYKVNDGENLTRAKCEQNCTLTKTIKRERYSRACISLCKLIWVQLINSINEGEYMLEEKLKCSFKICRFRVIVIL